MGRGIPRQGRRRHRRHLPQRPHAHRPTESRGRTLRRTRRPQLRREHRAVGCEKGTDENRHSGTHRQAIGPLRGYGGTARRERLSSVLVLRSSPPAATVAVLDVQHQRGGARHTPRRHCQLTALQRSDTEYRTTLLSVDRDKACHIPRQKESSALPRTRGHRHKRDVPQRILVEHAMGDATRGYPSHSGTPRRKNLPSGICHRIRLFRPDTAQALVGIEDDWRSFPRRTGQRHHGLRGGRGPGNSCRHQRRPALRWQQTVHHAPRRELYRRSHRRPHHEGRRRTIPYVHLEGRIPHTAPPGRCRRPADGEIVQNRSRHPRALRLVEGET